MTEQVDFRKLFSKEMKPKLIIAGVALVGLLLLMMGGIQHAAWSQGYMAGITAAGGEAANVVARGGHHAHGFGIIGGIFRLGFFILMFIFFAKVFRMIMWRAFGHKGRAAFARHWAHHGPPGRHYAEKFGSHAPWNRSNEDAQADSQSANENADKKDPKDQFYV